MKEVIFINCRILKKQKCEITNNFTNNHQAVDLVGENKTLDYVVAHTGGKIIILQDGLNNQKGSTGNASYGNFVKIDHGNGYYTLYAHMKKGLSVKNNQIVSTGETIGYIGDSGNAYGAHLHFEVWQGNKRINPTQYLNKNLPNENENIKELTYSVGDTIKINGIYVSSTSTERLIPAIKEGKITKILSNARNPYLLEDGKIGWVNESDIIKENQIKYLSNKNYKGSSLVDALKQININSSYNYRKTLAKLNGIINYTGTSTQNTNLLNLLKQGKLKY